MLINLLVDFVNFLISSIGKLLSLLLSFLPNSPFQSVDLSSIQDFLGYMNYLIPVVEIVSILTAWCTAIGIYYIYQIALRWAKAVE